MSIQQPLSLRERTRILVRGEIVNAAMTLFLKQGFDNTSVDDIAQETGISRRSYFRYFASKDDALAAGLTSIGNTIAESLATRPAKETSWTALRRSFDSLISQAENDPESAALGRLMLERTDLQHGKNSSWQATLAAALNQRDEATGHSAKNHTADPAEPDTQENPEAPLMYQAQAASALACLHTAQAQWLDPNESQSLGELLDIAMNAVAPISSQRCNEAPR